MSARSSAVVAKLRNELHAMMEQALPLAAAARFRRVARDGLHDLVATLEPSPAARMQAEELERRLQRWRNAVAFLLHRYALASAEELDRLMKCAKVYVGLQRQTGPNIVEGRWRAAFCEELTALTLQLEAILDRCAEAVVPADHAVDYEPLDIRLEWVSPASCRVSMRSRDELVMELVPLAISSTELDEFVESCRTPRDGLPVDLLPPMAAFGAKLFALVTAGSLAGQYASACRLASSRGARLLIRLHLSDAGLLARAPWELLGDGPDFLAVQPAAIARCIARPQLPRAPRSGVLRVLVTVCSPSNLAALDVKRERALLQDATGGLVLLGDVEVEIAPDGTLDTLRRMLRAADATGRPYAAWHFIGHGQFQNSPGRGELAMVGPDGRAHWIGGDELHVLFDGGPPLEFAIVNACESGSGGVDDPRSGIAQALVDCGARTVVGNQFRISDGAAIVLADELYGSLAGDADLLTSVSEARRAIFCQARGVEWMTPVVFMRSPPFDDRS
jgi:hypothetical protein